MESIALGIKKLMLDSELRERMSGEGIEYVKRYDWKYSVECLSRVYRELIQLKN